jgi:hypothetical protein
MLGVKTASNEVAIAVRTIELKACDFPMPTFLNNVRFISTPSVLRDKIVVYPSALSVAIDPPIPRQG